MWLLVFLFVCFRPESVFGDPSSSNELPENTNVENVGSSAEDVLSKIGKFVHELWDLISSESDTVKEISKSEIESSFSDYLEEGRGLKLKHKKTQLYFLMKFFMATKIILGILLPLGIIASKILSWKAVTFSLMAFMLGKILFIKNLFSGTTKFSNQPNTYVPPFLIHTAASDSFWKRQSETQPVYQYNS